MKSRKPTKDKTPNKPPMPANIKAPIEWGKTYLKAAVAWLITPINIKIAAIPPNVLLDSTVNFNPPQLLGNVKRISFCSTTAQFINQLFQLFFSLFNVNKEEEMRPSIFLLLFEPEEWGHGATTNCCSSSN
jgi:hypothetical protein